MRILFMCTVLLLCLLPHAPFADSTQFDRSRGGESILDSMIDRIADIQWEKGQTASAAELYRSTQSGEKKLAERLSTCFEEGVRAMRLGDFQLAHQIFSMLGDYENSGSFDTYCLQRMQMGPIPENKRLLSEENLIYIFPEGKLYLYTQGYLYVPDVCDENTSCCVYFAGGASGDWLYRKGVYSYLDEYRPNAMILFFFESGYGLKDKKTDLAASVIEQMAVEKGITIHDLITVGSSHGSYTALRASARFYTVHGYPVKKCILLDAGMEWDVPKSDLPTDAETKARIEAGTELMLFEQKTALKNKVIHDLVRRGEKVYVIICKVDDHNNISAYAYYNGVFSWGVGDTELLDLDQYHVIRLTKRDLIELQG